VYIGGEDHFYYCFNLKDGSPIYHNAANNRGGSSRSTTIAAFRYGSRSIFQVEAVIEMILTADVHAIADDCRRRIGLETGLVLPDKRAVARIQTIDAVIQVANHRRSPTTAGEDFAPSIVL